MQDMDNIHGPLLAFEGLQKDLPASSSRVICCCCAMKVLKSAAFQSISRNDRKNPEEIPRDSARRRIQRDKTLRPATGLCLPDLQQGPSCRIVFK